MRFIPVSRYLAVIVALAAVLAGCDPAPAVGSGCDLQSGDLAVSEIMANPLDDDSGREWFEVYNTTAKPQLLDRLVLKRLTLKDDGTVDFVDHTLRGAGTVAAKSYFVIGDGVVGVAPINYSYGAGGESFGALGNTQGGIALECQGRPIDEAWYGTDDGAPEPEEGHSLTFDGGVAPDPFLNKRGDWWCSANVDRYDGANYGTPGGPNDYCGFATCDTGGGAMRDVAPAKAGELIVTEVFADPDGADENKEWIEVYVAGARTVDLNGLFLTNATVTGSSHTYQVTSVGCISGEPGAYVVIGASTDRAVNGNTPVNVVADGMTLYSLAGTIELRQGRTVIDTATIPEATSKKSTSLDPMKLTAQGNDDPASFCLSRTTGLFDEVGTPGAANDLCGNSCMDGGVPRVANSPGVGELIVTEVYPNPGSPPSVADNYREWAEVYVSVGPVDLNGLTLVNTTITSTTTSTSARLIADTQCLTFPQGAYVVIGGANAASVDQVPTSVTIPGVTASTGLVFANSSASAVTSSVAIQLDSTVIDTMSYPLPTLEGQSYSLKSGVLDPSLNDVAANWCWSTTAHLPFTGQGSPGAANDACP